MHWDMQPIEIPFCCPSRVSPDHQCNHQGSFSDVQQFTVVFFWMTSHDLCSRGSRDCGRVKAYTVPQRGLRITDRPQVPRRVTKSQADKHMCMHIHTNAHTGRECWSLLEPPGQTDWCHWFSAITASVTESSRGKQTNTPCGLSTQTTLALALSKYAFAALAFSKLAAKSKYL